MRSIGADRVLDYTQLDFTRAGEKYDLIFDCVSNHSFSDYRRVLRPKGVLIVAGDQTVRGAFGIVGRLTVALVLSTLTSQTFVRFLAKPNQEDLSALLDLMKPERSPQWSTSVTA